MIYLNKYEQVEYWLYTATDNVYSCEETGDGLVWYDGNSWTLEAESLSEKLTNARAEALARLPKRVEYSTTVETLPHYSSGSTGFGVEHTFKPEFFPHGTKVKIIIEEVQE